MAFCYTCFQKNALHAEEQFLHGRTKLRFATYRCSAITLILYLCIDNSDLYLFIIYYYRQAGKQIRNVIHSAYKIERQAGGMQNIVFCIITKG